MSSLYGRAGLSGPTGEPTRGMRGSTGNIAGYKKGQLANFTPEQMQLLQSMFGELGSDSYTGRLASGDQSLFEEMEAPAMRQFAGLQGNIASRFSGMGSGARRSSGFQNTMSQASSNFAQDLQSRRQELQRNAIRDLWGMKSDLLGQRPYENFLVPPKKSFLEEIFGGGGDFLGNIGKIGSLFL